MHSFFIALYIVVLRKRALVSFPLVFYEISATLVNLGGKGALLKLFKFLVKGRSGLLVIQLFSLTKFPQPLMSCERSLLVIHSIAVGHLRVKV